MVQIVYTLSGISLTLWKLHLHLLNVSHLNLSRLFYRNNLTRLKITSEVKNNLKRLFDERQITHLIWCPSKI